MGKGKQKITEKEANKLKSNKNIKQNIHCLANYIVKNTNVDMLEKLDIIKTNQIRYFGIVQTFIKLVEKIA